MTNRRTLLKQLGLMLLPVFSPSFQLFNKFKPNQLIKWEGHLVLEEPMTWEQFCSQILETLDTNVSDAVNEQLKRQGKLVKSETRFTGQSVHWVFYFKDESSFQYWIKETGSKAFKDDFKFANFSTDTTLVNKVDVDLSVTDLVLV